MKIPAPTILDPSSVPALRWGVMGPGEIASTFVSSVLANTAQKMLAVASRTPGKAEAFAAAHGIGSVSSSYQELVERDDLDAIYIASYPSDHAEHALLAIAAGKHVLIEKPLALSSADAQRVLSAARSAGVLAMEAMWTRYLPQSTIIRALHETGELGAPELFVAQFCTDNRAIDRLWAPGGGGIAFDMGIYAVAMAHQFLGNPSKVSATGSVHPGGADQESFVTMDYESGARASLVMSGIASLPQSASCSFEAAQVVLDAPFLVPSGIHVTSKDFYPTGEHWVDSTGIVGHEGLCYQATWFAHYVEQGLLESPVHTHQDVVDILRVLETVVDQVTGGPPLT